MATFSNRLKELRLKNNLTQKALGELVDSSERAIQSYELEQRKPTLDVITSLADFFDVSADYLLGRDNYWQDREGHIHAKVPLDIINLDVNTLKKKHK